MKGLRLAKRIPLLPHLWLNVSKTGLSLSVKVLPGITLNLAQMGARITLGVPGTGMSVTRNFQPTNKKG